MATPSEQSATAAAGAVSANKQGSGVYKHLVEQHEEAFALVKRLGMRSGEDPRRELEPMERTKRIRHRRDEMAEVYAALRAIVQAELLEPETAASDLADAIAALDAINPGSPEWDPTFLLLSELVEARFTEEPREYFAESDEPQQVLVAC